MTNTVDTSVLDGHIEQAKSIAKSFSNTDAYMTTAQLNSLITDVQHMRAKLVEIAKCDSLDGCHRLAAEAFRNKS